MSSKRHELGIGFVPIHNSVTRWCFCDRLDFAQERRHYAGYTWWEGANDVEKEFSLSSGGCETARRIRKRIIP